MKKNTRFLTAAGGLAAAAVVAMALPANAAQPPADHASAHAAVGKSGKRLGTKLGDDPNGCEYLPPTNIGAGGWNCAYDDNTATVTVPAGVTGMSFGVAGGQGGNSNPAAGGYGGAVNGQVAVSPGDQVTIDVGGGAADHIPGLNANPNADGGTASSTAGAGGAASVLEVNGTTVAVGSGGGGGGAQGLFPGSDDGGRGGTSTVDGGNGSGGKGPGSGNHGPSGAGGSSLTPGQDGHGGHHGGGASGAGGGGWSGGDAGTGGSWGGGGGGGGGAGGDYAASSVTNATFNAANGGGDGLVTIRWTT